ncbi:hypothetical protein EAI_06726 [Harpegnathos saltator]|uniref:Uncharacterized protein n=1 Tax=Harpegnathos saltator TaxID=610380 RepID=E2C9G7_HARSA|nr:hypothetical protein EAI_06726 [Harpegnathos saltator]
MGRECWHSFPSCLHSSLFRQHSGEVLKSIHTIRHGPPRIGNDTYRHRHVPTRTDINSYRRRHVPTPTRTDTETCRHRHVLTPTRQINAYVQTIPVTVSQLTLQS